MLQVRDTLEFQVNIVFAQVLDDRPVCHCPHRKLPLLKKVSSLARRRTNCYFISALFVVPYFLTYLNSTTYNHCKKCPLTIQGKKAIDNDVHPLSVCLSVCLS